MGKVWNSFVLPLDIHWYFYTAWSVNMVPMVTAPMAKIYHTIHYVLFMMYYIYVTEFQTIIWRQANTDV